MYAVNNASRGESSMKCVRSVRVYDRTTTPGHREIERIRRQAVCSVVAAEGKDFTTSAQCEGRVIVSAKFYANCSGSAYGSS